MTKVTLFICFVACVLAARDVPSAKVLSPKNTTLVKDLKSFDPVVNKAQPSIHIHQNEEVDIDCKTLFNYTADDIESGMVFQTNNLPDGMTADNGHITGSSPHPGVYKIEIIAKKPGYLDIWVTPFSIYIFNAKGVVPSGSITPSRSPTPSRHPLCHDKYDDLEGGLGDYCFNGGICTVTRDNIGVDSQTCLCDHENWLGTRCHTENPCLPISRVEGKTCDATGTAECTVADYTDDQTAHTCTCKPNYIGRTCATIDPCTGDNARDCGLGDCVYTSKDQLTFTASCDCSKLTGDFDEDNCAPIVA